MAEDKLNATIESLFKGMDSVVSTKTVVGDAITIGETIILPLVDVSFGIGAGASLDDKKNNGGGGMGGKISPSAVLVISKNSTRLVNIKNQDAITKILDLVPDLMDRFGNKKDDDIFDTKKESKKKANKDHSWQFCTMVFHRCGFTTYDFGSYFGV